MSFVILQTFNAAEGRYDDLAQMISRMLVDTAAREGAEFVHAAGDRALGVITVYQQWATPESQKAYTQWRMQQPDTTSMFALIKGAPKIDQLAHLF